MVESQRQLLISTVAAIAVVVGTLSANVSSLTHNDNDSPVNHLRSGNTASNVSEDRASEPKLESSIHSISGIGFSTTNDDESLRLVQRQYIDTIQPLLKQYCAECHWGEGSEADFNLEGYQTLDQLLNGRKKWKKVIVRMAAKEMPPEDYEEVPDDRHKLILDWVDKLLNSVDCSTVNPGRVTIRRLNATEYSNTIRDLVGVDYKPARDFPGDDVGYGFDNIADVLSLPPILMEKYLHAAEEITQMAIADPDKPALTQTITGADFNSAEGSGLNGSVRYLFTNGTIQSEIEVPVSGKYEVVIRAFQTKAGNEAAKMSFSVNGKKSQTRSVKGDRESPGDYEFSTRLRKGKQQIEVTFENDFYDSVKEEDRNLYLDHVVIKGPFGSVPASHRKLIPSKPKTESEQRTSARAALNIFSSRAYRRRTTSPELDRLMALYDAARADGDNYELALRFAFQGVLVSPYFLYKIEAPAEPGETRNLSDFELATNLSYFLWSTMPDKELFKLATQKKLRDPKIYRQQIKRMMKDKRASALVENFVAQWLQLRHLEHFKPDPDLFPGVDARMRKDMATETKMTIADLIRTDASILSILDNDYSFMNERLADHYGIPSVKGDNFRKVFTAKYGRTGLMTQASILTLTSNPTRTSPVKRGKWIMENLLGEEPPPPDPDAMQLEDQAELKGTLRQRMEQHRANPSCAVCHKVMDELGFALENYDAVGQWRDVEDTNTIDATGELPDGTIFNGASELQKTVKSKMRDQYVRCLTEKMLIYGLGRGLEYFDECTVDKIIEQTKANDYKFSELIIAVATSDPFTKRQGTPVTDEE